MGCSRRSYISTAALLTILVLSEANPSQTCRSIQYLKLSTPGLVHCGFAQDLFGVFWYNSTDYINERPLLYFQNSVKSGRGYVSGEFDITLNGSLIINQVSIQHDHNFTVIAVETTTDEPVPTYIRVVVTVEPSQHHPVISGCENQRICFSQIKQEMHLKCLVTNTRPPVQLSWFMRTLYGDGELTSNTSISTDNILYSTSATLLYNPAHSFKFVVLTCKETSLPRLLKDSETVLVLESPSNKTLPNGSALTYTKYDSKIELRCSDEAMLYFAWKKQREDKSFQNLVYGLFGEELDDKKFTNEYEIDSTGTITAREVGFQHEGIYICLYGDGMTEGQKVYNVFVYVPPIPAYPLVDGCSHLQYCVLTVGQDGVLTCSVRGIRPSVELEWSSLNKEASDVITFSKQQMNIVQKDGIFDISLTSKFHIHHQYQMRLTVECKVLGYSFTTFDLSTKLDLLYLPDAAPPTSSERTPLARGINVLFPVIVVAVVVLFVIATIVMCLLHKARRNRRHASLRTLDHPENLPMIVESLEEKTTRKQEIFKDQLKRKYLDLCETFLPIPFLPEKKYRIDEIFVDGGIEVFTSNSGKKKTWQKMKSYHNILTLKNNPTRIILEGDPGIGKSTISLQMAYDWCHQDHSSSIFILLKLRNLAGTDSIPQAIKSSLLPVDSELSEKDIQSIIMLSEKMTIVLDSFDKYPAGSDYHNTVIKSIMMNKILTNAVVILTTRPSCLPIVRHPSAVRLRLTGFNTNSQLEYISKAIRSTEKDIHVLQNIVQRLLEENPVLSALCQVPLFFVHLVHITHEDNIGATGFPTVTSFFSNVMKCFENYAADRFLDDKLSLDSTIVQSVQLKTPPEFDEMIFSGLRENHRRIYWEKGMLIDKLGEDCYKHYLQVGLFYEEDFKDDSTSSVRFYHNIFCEWFAGLHLSRLGKEQNPRELQDLLKTLNPVDLQYVFRFACGLSTHAAEKIIKYLENCKDGQKFAILCIMEQEKQDKMSEKVISTVKSLCQSPISINSHESRLLHVSTLELLKIASSLKIPIKLVWLTDMKTKTDHSKQKLQFNSGLILEKLDTLLQLSIGDVGRTFSKDELIETLHYAKSCSNLNTLRFRGCILPLAIDNKKLPEEILKRKLTVEWSPVQKNRWYRLNLKTGQWELERTPVKEKEYSKIIARVRSLWKPPSSTSIDKHNISGVSQELAEYLGKEVIDQPSKLQDVVRRHCLSPVNMDSTKDLTVQRATIDLLKIASECKIHIECVWLVNMNCLFCQGGLNLRSDLILPTLETLKQLSILDEGRNYSEGEFVGITKYASLCPVLSNLSFSS